MASFFTIGEPKLRPGVYYRYENYGSPPVAGADDGICAAVFRSNWGPVGVPLLLENYGDAANKYGTDPNGTSAVALEQFKGGARTVCAVRLGTGGSAGTYQLMDTTSPTAKAVITLTLTHPGSRSFNLTVRPTLENPDLGELLFLDGVTVLERYTFDRNGGSDQITSLVDTVGASPNPYFTLTKLEEGSGELDIVDQAAVTPGTDPTVDIAAYSAAFEALDSYRWNLLAIDTTDPAVQLVLQLYLNKAYNSGKFVMGVIGGDPAADFDTRLQRAASFNDYQMVYVGNGFIDGSGTVYNGWRAAARVAGMIAGTPSNESVTHLAVAGAVSISDPLTNHQYEQAFKSGMLTFSLSASNTVWIEQGINTLVLPKINDDEGWKKIKRVKVRFELFSRLNDSVERLIGRINNDSDGHMTIIQAGNGVCNAMVAERKLLAGARCEIDPDNRPSGDSAWFLVQADDIDALEKLFFTFKFRFAPGEDQS